MLIQSTHPSQGRWIHLLVGLCLFSGLGSTYCFARPLASIQESRNNPLEGFRWTIAKDLDVEIIDQGERGVLDTPKARCVIKLRGLYKRRYSTLLLNYRPLSVSPDGNFSIPVSVNAPSSKLTLVAVDVHGNVNTREFRMAVSEWQEVIRKKQGRGRWVIAPELDLTHTQYRQPLFPDYTQFSLTTKVRVDKRLGERTFAEANFYSTVLPFPSQAEAGIRFVGGSLLGGFAPIHGAWQLDLLAGLHYATTLVQSNAFGYQDVGGPQFMPMLRKHLAVGRTLTIYTKFSPIFSSGLGLMSLGSSEIEFGSGYTIRLPSISSPLEIHAAYSTLSLEIPRGTIQTTSLSLGLSLRY